MKAARLAGFDVGLAAGEIMAPPAKSGAVNLHGSSPRAPALLEIVKNLVAGSNFGLGEVLVYGAPQAQGEAS